MRDVVVAGAGPSGSYLSYTLSKKGYDVLNLEDHPEVGRPVECTGVVTERVFRFVRSKSIANRVSGAYVYFPDSEPMHIRKNEETIVIYRDSFDKDVSAMAVGAGTDLRVNSRLLGVKIHEDCAEVTYRENGQIRTEKSRIVIGADGANSVVRKDLYREKPKRIVSTYQVDSAVRMEDQDSVSVYLGSENSRGFFAWAVPTGNITRIGLGTLGSGAREYYRALEKHFPGDRVIGITGGPIPISYLKRTYGNRSLLIGDAAGIVKPLTGGGIYTGIVSAGHAFRAVDEALENDNCTQDFLSRYQKYWKEDIGRELFIDGLIQKFFSKLSDRSLKAVYKVLSSPDIIDRINSIGDIDYPSKLVFSVLLKHPSILLNALI